MMELRFHGRGGQGVVVGCEVLAKALLLEGKYVQFFPSFGTERRGASVLAFLRLDDKKIYLRHQIYQPDVVIVFDPYLGRIYEPNAEVALNSSLGIESVTSGLKPRGRLILNSSKEPAEFKVLAPFTIATVDANEIALKYKIGTEAMPIVNTVMLGAVVKVVGFSIDSLTQAIMEKFGQDETNLLGAREAYERVKLGKL